MASAIFSGGKYPNVSGPSMISLVTVFKRSALTAGESAAGAWCLKPATSRAEVLQTGEPGILPRTPVAS